MDLPMRQILAVAAGLAVLAVPACLAACSAPAPPRSAAGPSATPSGPAALPAPTGPRPVGSTALEILYGQVVVHEDGCVGCGVCQNNCPTEPKSITVTPRALRDRQP
jgi:NAD-dependent dihydropyrimidine dehydrogenase PreA subunit